MAEEPAPANEPAPLSGARLPHLKLPRPHPLPSQRRWARTRSTRCCKPAPKRPPRRLRRRHPKPRRWPMRLPPPLIRSALPPAGRCRNWIRPPSMSCSSRRILKTPPRSRPRRLGAARDVELRTPEFPAGDGGRPGLVDRSTARCRVKRQDRAGPIAHARRGCAQARRRIGGRTGQTRRRSGRCIRERSPGRRGEVLVLNDNFCVRVNEIVAGAKDELP